MSRVIRFGAGAWAGYEAERLWHEPSVVVCNERVAQHGRDRDRLMEIADTRLIHVVGHENHWAEAFRLVGIPMPQPAKAMRVDNSVAAVLLAASSGATIVLRPFAKRAIEMLPLHLPFDFELPIEQAHYLLTPIGLSAVRPEVLLFRQWIIAESASL